MNNGRTLTFRLAAINNQNFIMRDEETGSWWQQVSGEAVFGPLAGEQLELLNWDEVSLEIWRREYPDTLVLLPDGERTYDREWQESVAELPTPEPSGNEAARASEPLPPRELVIGLTADSLAKAYPFTVLIEQSPVLDQIGPHQVLLVVADDGESVRCFDRTLDGQPLEFFRKTSGDALLLVDSKTGSEWNFSGSAISGPLEGRRLTKIQVHSDYWFNWHNYHPETEIFRAGQIGP